MPESHSFLFDKTNRKKKAMKKTKKTIDLKVLFLGKNIIGYISSLATH